MEKKIFVVINEQHTLLENQVETLNKKFGENSWQRMNVPADGWSAEEQLRQLVAVGDATLVFASPLPLMLRDASRRNAETFVFHNDGREKKELPNGKIIFTVAQTGWVIL